MTTKLQGDQKVSVHLMIVL